MADVLTDEQRQRCMSRIQGKDTRPEMVVRRLVHGMGFRYRLHSRSIPGKPDLVFSSRHKIILVHGCFWHRHNCELGKPVPATRTDFWLDKFRKNKQRDRRNLCELRRLGWDVLIIWECQTRPKRREWLLQRLAKHLNSD